jgi:predicted nucleic acid-binding protein
MILSLAVSGKADVIVTGDSDLLVLPPFKKIAILKPEAFLTVYPSKDS